MRRALALICLLAAVLPGAALAQSVTASDPHDVAVTIYRDPQRGSGGAIELDALGGFAVVTEKRRVTLPAGRASLRFVGVVDGILPESAIVTGLPGGVIEKNRDGALLSPAALLRATQGRSVQLRRTNRDTGKTTLVPARLISASEDGVLFETAQGKEALRCSGLGETFAYGLDTSGLSARPVLSVTTRSPRALTAEVTLTYLAEGFDWNASYTAAVDPAARAMDLGGWITLANGNSVSLDNAQVQVVAGGLNRAAWRKLVDGTPRAVARCWSMQRTHQIPRKAERPYELVRPYEEEEPEIYEEDDAGSIIVSSQRRSSSVKYSPAPVMAAPPPPPPPQAEQLGDLKLYRLAERTSVAARQMKQTRLLDKPAVPFERIYKITLDPLDPNVGDVLTDKVGGQWEQANPIAVLRSRNDKAHGLGLPLPSGAFVIGQDHAGRAMLLGQPPLRDTAEDEKIELALGPAPDVTIERRTTRRTKRQQWQELRLSNAGAEAINLELRFNAWGSIRLTGSSQDAPLSKEDGQPIFKLELPPNSTRTLRYTVRWD